MTDPATLKEKLAGCYVTVPTPFADRDGWPVDEQALRSYVRFLLDHGLTADYATFLAENRPLRGRTRLDARSKGIVFARHGTAVTGPNL